MSATSIRNKQPNIPLFTPAPDCFNDIWAAAESRDNYISDSNICTIFSLGKNDGYDVKINKCLTATYGADYFPGTDCPISYTEEYSRTYTYLGTTTGLLTCCPKYVGEYDILHPCYQRTDEKSSQQSFTYTETGHNSIPRCVVKSPSLPGSGSPWLVPLLPKIKSDATTTASAVFDPDRDVLIARALFMANVIENSTTCAPNCASPYTGGVYSPSTATETGERCDHSLCQTNSCYLLCLRYLYLNKIRLRTQEYSNELDGTDVQLSGVSAKQWGGATGGKRKAHIPRGRCNNFPIPRWCQSSVTLSDQFPIAHPSPTHRRRGG